MTNFRHALKFAGYGLLLLTGLVVATFALGVVWPEPEHQIAHQPGPFALTGATVIDIASAELLVNQTVVVEGNRIVSIGERQPVPAGMRAVDAKGKYLMPALWDMHTHVYAISPLLDMPLYIAYGVTNVRDLQGCPAKGDPFIACFEDKKRWSREAEAGTRVGPRILEASSFMANGPGMAERLGNVPDYFDTRTATQARQFVAHYDGRADSIKVYDRIPRDAYLALVDEAKQRDLPVVGHKPHAVSTLEVTKYQRSIEHARFILHDSFDGSGALRSAAGTPAWKEDRRAMVDRHDPAKADEILSAMRSHGTYYVPTHLTRWSDAYADKADVRDDPESIYLHPLLRMQWLEDLDSTLAADPDPLARKAYVDFYEKGLELTAKAQAAGVQIMVGTDYIAPGVDVHRELEQLVKAGLTPRQALAAATLTPARYAGQSESYGVITAGRRADMLLLDANPLEDIRNTRRIEAVVFNGMLYDRRAVEGLKKQAKANARSWTVGAKIIWRFIKSPANY